jgi:hypothetical protein
MRIGMGLAGAAALIMATAPLQALAAGPPPQGYVGDPVRGPNPQDDSRFPPATAVEPVYADDRGYDQRDQEQDGSYQQQGQWSSGQQYERREYRERAYGQSSGGERYQDEHDQDGGYRGDDERGGSRYSSGGYSYEHREAWRDERGARETVYASNSGGGFANGYHSNFSSQSGWNSGGYVEPCNPRLRDAYGRSADCPGELTLAGSFFAYGEGSVGPTWLGAPGGGGGGGGGFAEAGAGASASASASASVRVSIRGGGRGHGGPPPHGGGCGCHH